MNKTERMLPNSSYAISTDLFSFVDSNTLDNRIIYQLCLAKQVAKMVIEQGETIGLTPVHAS
jgi:hypothetical protein